ncbi:ABC transporter permease [Pedococcus bigeumensis]|nr:FtsX-like permease family protein [Pedococcus bigeumensis]
MTTLMEREAPAGMPRGSDRDEDQSSRLSRWRASWRVALRMAKRDAWRYKGRSVLVLIMVALPVGVLVGTLVFATSSSVSSVERIPTSLGSAQALIQGPSEQVVWQTADPNEGWSTDSNSQPDKATPVPGFNPGESLGSAANVAALQQVTGGTVVPVGEMTLRRVLDERRTRGIQVATFAAGTVDLGTKATLVSGRWPATAGEIAATPYGISRGMPDHGTTTLRSAGKSIDVTVVGVANFFNGWGGQPDAISARPLDPEAVLDWQYLLLRDAGVPYSEVKKLNAYGLQVTSAEALRNPPSPAALPPTMRQMQDYAARDVQTMVAIGGVLLLLVTTLLVAPAFAVSASRQRRTLALAASNGAETRQLRRKVLAQALLLGALSAIVAAGLAVLAVRVVMWVLVARRPWTTFRFFEVPLWAVAAVIVMAVVSALVAALIPALRLRRLDIVGVMKGQNVSPRLNRVVPVLGVLLAGTGGVGLVAAVATKQREYTIAGLAIALTVGALMLVPLVLVVAGRLSARLPVAARMATRDAARHRARSVPTVAAIMAGAIALTAFSIGLASDTEQSIRDYQPQQPAGQGAIFVASDLSVLAPGAVDPALEDAEELVRGLTPDLVSTRLAQVTTPFDPKNPNAPVPFVTVVKPGCTVDRAVTDAQSDQQSGRPVCQLLGTNGQRSIAVLPAADITRLLRLSPSDSARVSNGGIAVNEAALISTAGTVAVASGTVTTNQNTGLVESLKDTRTAALPAVVGKLPMAQGQYGGVVTPETASKLGWFVGSYSLLLRNPDGAISKADEKALSEQLGEDGGVYVERGFVRDDILIMRILFVAFGLLLLIVTLISTALALAEQQSDMGTLAAVGATKGTRRRLAAAQAATVAFIGALVGIAVGLAPGIAVSYPLTADSYDPETGRQLAPDPITVIPWLPLGLLLVAVPVIAALLSAAAIRRAPALTRRAD